MTRAVKFIAILIILILAGVVITRLIKLQSRSGLVSPLPDDKRSIIEQIFIPAKNPDDLKKILLSKIGNNLKNYSISVEDYNSNFLMTYNENIIYTGASVNKLPILAALYYYAQKGDINLDQIITLQNDEIQDYGTGTIRYDPSGTTYSVKTLARLMMQVSDNTAAYILANEIIGMPRIQDLIGSWGLSQTDMPNNKTSNHDMRLLFKKIITEKAANHALTLEMLDFMKNTDYEDRLPANLPKNINVYHKTGNGDNVIHDVGVINNGKTRYYVGIMTSDNIDEAAAVKLIAQISKVIYDFMN